MKTPPVQHSQAADSRHEPTGLESEGKSMAPPAFQLKTTESSSTSAAAKPVHQKAADPQAVQDSKQESKQVPAEVLTITDGNAYLRSGAPTFAPLKSKITQGTRVDVLEESVVGGKTYIRVQDHDTGAELGWTAKANAVNLDKKYKPASATHVYNVGGHDILVFMPKDGLKKTNVDVFMFFHGRGSDYSTTQTHAKSKGFDDNPAISANIADAVSKSGGIAICPQGHGFKVENDWGAIGAGGFQKMIDTTLAHLSTDLGMSEKPLTAGNVSLAGHSAGGNALGQAAQDTGATDVTLQEAGYNFTNSWTKLRDWFMLGQSPKTMRVVTQNNGNRHATRTLLRDAQKVDGKPVPAGKFNPKEIVDYSKQLVKDGKLQGPVKIEEFQGDGKVEAGDIVLERGFRVLRSDGSLMGSLRLYHLADENADHWAAATQTMESSMTNGAKDRATDKAAMEKR